MKIKNISLLLCLLLLINIFFSACSNGDKNALAAGVQSQSRDLSSIDLESDNKDSEKDSDVYKEPEYTLTSEEKKIAEKASDYMNGLDFSGSVILCVNNRIIYKDAFGYADKKLKINNTNKTVYQIASLTKQFTGAAILLLQEQGKLNVKDKLSKYLPDYSNGDKITIENLLFMTSGLQDFADAYILDSLDPDKEYPVGYMYDLIKDYDLWSTPGTSYEYCNTNYYILGMIIEKTSGMNYEEFIKENIFKPLHMDSTGFDTSMVTAKGYSWGNEFSYSYDDSIFYSAGAICSTTEDMSRWLRGFWDKKIISKKSIDYILANNSKLGYSCGWVVSQKGIMRHSGNLGGYKTFAMIDYENNICVAVLSNNEQQLSAEIGLHLDEIAKIILQ